MAIYQHTDPPPTWKEFEARCQERIAKIRQSEDQGQFAGMYANDVELLLAVLRDSHLEYHGSPARSYQVLLNRKPSE